MFTNDSTIPDNIAEWCMKQEMFWVATSPLSGTGHINLSPKGLKGTFHIIDSKKVWYEDLTGSGVETISHIRENGRIVIMFCAFEGPPRITRIWGKGTVHEFGTPEYEALVPPETRSPGSRSAIAIDVEKVTASCGYGVPHYSFVGHRKALTNWGAGLERRELKHASESTDPSSHAENGLFTYWIQNGRKSMDGLPGLKSAHVSTKLPLSMATVEPRDAKQTTEAKEMKGTDAKKTVKDADSFHAEAGAPKGGEYLRLALAFGMGLFVADLLSRFS
ncbi:uncharacterized protein STEHIDRAFT_124845 [Stereum hirsutum FP-91666 SS1]|uniref:uncharacterized protein n=1 Tax=Stereum hirsutum (strain FP-91666) TaxID=721885 RepID=UPI0004449948|nr:uncharacterized protein STEHIDRAFT_124845 [Stereum hirsutum FP-91666 SS1]EIM82013.1 hypothetical protein STEHIDRAFT_124845 [Stereum hirsutum FP-91666 SS1]